MDLQFSQSVFHCLQQCAREYQTQEQTQEVRIPEGMPDIGIVLACWGQVILRGKEWRSEQVGINGGVMAKVLYLPEEGDQPQVVEAWLPFQMKWQIPADCQDGAVTVLPMLRSADARTLSARKLMVRTNVGVLMQACCPGMYPVYMPEDVPEDVQLLTTRQELTVMKEAGEKTLNLEEVLELTGRDGQLDQLIHISLCPQVLEQKVLSDKLVFRGLCIAHMLYRTPDGQLQSRDFDVPFSQYAELEQAHSPEAYPIVIPIVTNMELETTPEGHVRLKAGLSGQYTIVDRAEIALVQDAYSPQRKLELTHQSMMIPQMVERSSRPVTAQADPQVDIMRPVDLVFWLEQPYLSPGADAHEADMSGTFQLLYYDTEGQLQCTHSRWEERQQFPTQPDVQVALTMTPGGRPQYGVGMLNADLLADMTMTVQGGMEMLTAGQMGEASAPDPNRPSLVITKAGTSTLWQLAKENGSTPEKIRQANGLDGEPTHDQVLLIPVI